MLQVWPDDFITPLLFYLMAKEFENRSVLAKH